MPELLRMPEVAANTTSAVLAAWPVEVNVEFRTNDPIVTVETDKAVVDVEAESDGVILKTLVAPGVNVEVGAPIAVVGKLGERVDDLDAVLTELGVGQDLLAGARSMPRHSHATRDDGGGRDDAGTGQSVDDMSGAHLSAAATNDSPSDGNARVFSSPLARRVARDHGLTLSDLTGTGPNGRVVRKDVELAVAVATRVAQDATAATPQSSRPADPDRAARFAPSSQREDVFYDDIPNTRVRTAIAARLGESKQTVPHFYLRGSAEVDALLALRAELNAAAPIKISVNDLIVKAVAKAHAAVPNINAIWTGAAIRRFRSVDVAVAVSTGEGLVTPVLRRVEQLSITSVAEELQAFARRARDGQLRQAELEGGSTTVSNLGMFGTEEFAAIINPPQSTILAVGGARQRAVVKDGQVQPATVMNLTMSVDHRVVDGAVAADWMQTLVRGLENPLAIIV